MSYVLGIYQINQTRERSTHFFMGRENCKPGPCGLVLVRRPERPERDRSPTKLGKPAFKFRLSGVVWKSAHMKNLAPLRKKCPDISSSIHWTAQNIRMLLRRLGFADQASKNSCQSNGLFHCTARRCWCQCLQVERKIMLDRSRCLYGFYF